MALEIQHTDNVGFCRMIVNDEMTIYVIEDLKREFSEVIDEYDTFEVDLSAVEEIDSAGIQLLLAFGKELKKRDKDFRLSTVSKAVADLLDCYEIGDRFSIGEAA